MIYLKTYEGFEYHGQKYSEQICDLWGVIDLEDLENLFLEFADEGEVLIHPMIVNKEIQVTIHKIWQDLDDSDWLYNPLWDSRFERIKNQLNRLGLGFNVETKNLNQRFVSVRISKNSIKESFEVVMSEDTNEIISSYGLTMEDIEELFLDFSDMGYTVKIGPYGMRKESGLLVDVTGESFEDPYSPEISQIIRRVVRKSTDLGLYCMESPIRMNPLRVKGKWSSTIRFTFNKR